MKNVIKATWLNKGSYSREEAKALINKIPHEVALELVSEVIGKLQAQKGEFQKSLDDLSKVKVVWPDSGVKESYSSKEVETLVNQFSLTVMHEIIGGIIEKVEAERVELQKSHDELNSKQPDTTV
jgi:hypothetical protein